MSLGSVEAAVSTVEAQRGAGPIVKPQRLTVSAAIEGWINQRERDRVKAAGGDYSAPLPGSSEAAKEAFEGYCWQVVSKVLSELKMGPNMRRLLDHLYDSKNREPKHIKSFVLFEKGPSAYPQQIRDLGFTDIDLCAQARNIFIERLSMAVAG